MKINNLVVFCLYFGKIIVMELRDHLKLGKSGEDMACEYLVNNRWKIIDRNFRRKFGELDIIAKEKSGILVFVEVKTMTGNNDYLLKPEDQMTKSKIGKFKKIAQYYAGLHPEFINDKKGWRLDLLTLTILEKNCIIKHYENIT